MPRTIALVIGAYPSTHARASTTSTETRIHRMFNRFFNSDGTPEPPTTPGGKAPDAPELANGYFELTDAGEQAARFEQDRAKRAAEGLPDMAADTLLLAALESGLPDCAGVALGFDRTLMALKNCTSLAETMAFPPGD